MIHDANREDGLTYFDLLAKVKREHPGSLVATLLACIILELDLLDKGLPRNGYMATMYRAAREATRDRTKPTPSTEGP